MNTLTIWRPAPSKAKCPLVTISPFDGIEDLYIVTLGVQKTGRCNQSYYWPRENVDVLIKRHIDSGNRIEGTI